MGKNRLKRSSNDGITTTRAGQPGQVKGVGGRQGSEAPPARGGGSPDVCSIPNSSFRPQADRRLAELQQIGLAPKWLEVAAAVGIDNFIETWRILDRENIGSPKGGREKVRLYVPLFSSYLRFQRNRFIRTLFEQGRSVASIQREIREQLNERISQRHIARIVSRVSNRQIE